MMNIEKVNNNYCEVAGEIVSDLVFSHQTHLEEFYSFVLKIARLSDTYDFLNVTIPSTYLTNTPIENGDKVVIKGQFRSYNTYLTESNKLVLTIFAKEVIILKNFDAIENPNNIILNGFICKQPVYRLTPFEREITDLLVAINRNYRKSDYIPCIAWGKNARIAKDLYVGQNIIITGRIQSREYIKKLSDTESITKTAYEVSISKIEIIDSFKIE